MYKSFYEILDLIIGLFADLFSAFNDLLILYFNIDLSAIMVDIRLFSDNPIVSLSLYDLLVIFITILFTWLFFRFIIKLLKRMIGVFKL